jgi:hypothetical protein
VTLSGWTITDNNDTDTIPDLTIAPKGFAVVAASSTGFATNYPGFSGTIVYIPDGIIGNGLSNPSDRLVLKKADGVEIDAVSWRDDDYAFGPGKGVKPATGAGHSIARKTKGVDTNSPDDWEKLTTPNPGTNPHPSEENQSVLIVESSVTPTLSPTPTTEPTPTPSPTPEASPTPTPIAEPSPTPVPSTTPTPSPSPEPSPMALPEPSPSPNLEPTSTSVPTPNPTSEFPTYGIA